MMKRTPRRMIFYICLVWLGAACISLPPLMIMGNEYMDSKNGPTRCSVSQNFFYQIYATLGSFYIPLAVMIKVYYQIFCAARNIVMEEIRAQLHLHGHCRFNVEPSISQPTASILNRQASPIKHRSSSASTTCSQVQCFVDAPRKSNESQCPMLQRVEKPIVSTSKKMTTTFIRNSTCSVTNSPQQKKLRLLVKERKASTTLGIIMGVFVCCWLPFFILALVRPFIHNYSYYIPEFLSDLFLWLGYCNSLLNPIIYAILNKDFRRPFREILFCRCGNLNHVMREEFYQSQYGDPSHNYQIKDNICSSGVIGGIGNIAKSSEDAEQFGDINEGIIDSVDMAGVRNESFL
ncbi:5-hydroxytryptamine receptor 1 isoform X2 [Pseudomyrmex gracilis]|nr:5-hydroxytryptamine receptor 1 isoform X2 [Pseudomyrmex gracilis]